MNGITITAKRAFERLLTDRMTVRRAVQTTDETGVSAVAFEPVMEDVPCYLSRVLSRQAYVDQRLPEPVVCMEGRVYTYADADIRPRDKLIVTHREKSFEWDASAPWSYETHLEIPVSCREYA